MSALAVAIQVIQALAGLAPLAEALRADIGAVIDGLSAADAAGRAPTADEVAAQKALIVTLQARLMAA